ncbi:MAG TPA: HisA/HisF family protein, partial [Candidatus Atribacteria bacterium]|nr:HisA/HisF family protein [Candidatus Atribacteria bacterium]
MKIVPVLDILNGEVVHGVRGERDKYRPIKSILTDSIDPLTLARAFQKKLGLNNLYIADLDSIMGKGNNFEIIKNIKQELNLNIMLDMGVRVENDLKREIINIVDEIILATETLSS